MIRPLFAALAALVLVGCAHMPLGASEGGAPETDRPVILPIMPAQDPEAALMLGVLVGEIAVRSGQYEEAARYYGAAALLSDDPAIAERATRIALFAQDRNQALQSSERWRQLAPESLDALQLSTVLRLDLGQPGPAAEQMGMVIDLQAVRGGDPYAALGAVVGQTRNREAALEALEDLTDQRQDDVGVHRVFAEAALRFAPGEPSLEATARGVERFPESVSLRLLRARALDEAGQSDEALEELRTTVASHPESREARFGYARMLAEHDDRDMAREEMDRLVEQDPEDVQLLLALALMNLEAEQLGPARTYLQRLDALGEREDEIAYYLGRLHEMEDDPEGARQAYERVAGGSHADDARLRAARMTLEIEGESAARERFEQMQQGPDTELARRAYVGEANLLREKGQYAAARERLNRGLVQFPGDTRLLYMRGLVHERKDDIEAAEADFRAILDNDPENVAALNALGYTLADRTDRYDEALGLIERAYAQEPDDAAIIDSYGWVLYRLGRLDEAEDFLRRAYDLSDDGEIASNLAVVLWEQGERDEARAILEAALERDPDHERLLRVRDELLN